MEKLEATWLAIEQKIIKPLSVLLLLAPTLLAILEVFRRYVLGKSFYWQIDVVTYTLLTSLFLHFSITQRNEEHLQVTFVQELLRKRGPVGRKVARFVSLLSRLAGMIFGIVFAYWGAGGVYETYKGGRLVSSLVMPIWPFFLFLVIGIAFMTITFFFQAWHDLRILIGAEPEPAPTDQTMVLNPEGKLGVMD